jgi:hypothetical protein
MKPFFNAQMKAWISRWALHSHGVTIEPQMDKSIPLSNVEVDTLFLVVPKIKPSCGPLFFTRSLEKAVCNVTANGSFGLVDTGEKKLLVTCWHVLEEFRNQLCDESDLKICACLAQSKNPVVLDLKNLIDEDRRFDLATFDMEPMLSVCEGRVFFPLNCGHIHLVKKGNRLAFVGYPAMHRSETDDGIYFGTTPHVVVAQDVSDYALIAETSRVMNVERKLLSEQHENPYGGVSGSPCFLVQKNLLVHPVAFVTEHHKGLQILKFTSAKCLNPDGTIKR